jgi:hypothetical protein
MCFPGKQPVEVNVKKVLVLLVAALAMSACSEAVTAPAAAKKSAPTNAASRDDITCRSGYVVAYDEDGNPYCTPDEHLMIRP